MIELEEEMSRRIAITRYFLVIGIVVLHLPPFVPIAESGTSLGDFIKAFFSDGVFRASVPVLTAISGFLLFRSDLADKPIALFRKKVTSLLIPMVLWNIPFAITIYLAQKYSILSHHFRVILYPFDLAIWINALSGLFGDPANYPLNFLRDLFAISLISPALVLLLRRIPYVGLIVILIICQFDLDGSYILRDTMLVNFYVGGLATTQNWNLKFLDRYARSTFSIFIATSIWIVSRRVSNLSTFQLFAPFLVWPSMSLITRSRLGDFLFAKSKASFFTFLAHGPLILIVWLIFNKLPFEAPYFIYWTFTPPLVVLLSIQLRLQFERYFPRLSAIALGGR